MTQSDEVYKLTIIGGRLPDDASVALKQVEERDRIVKQMYGKELGLWVWCFPTGAAADEATAAFRRIGIAFDEADVEQIEGLSGKDVLPPEIKRSLDS